MLKIIILTTLASLSVCLPPVKIELPQKNFGDVMPTYSLDYRLNCTSGVQPNNRVNTTARVSAVIDEMLSKGFQAYIVPSEDAHMSEYTQDADQRRGYISGFSGSAGVAVILTDGSRAVWTDGRYFTEANQTLDCNWLLMGQGISGVPSISEWLTSNLISGDMVGADARLFSASTWEYYESELAADGITFLVEEIVDGKNIVDNVWEADVLNQRPPYSTDAIFVHDISFADQTWQEKVVEMEAEMDATGSQLLIISMLDETAWVLNLRGSDIAYNPVFRSYVIIDTSAGKPSNVTLFVPDIAIKVDQSVLDHLLVDNCVSTDPCVRIVEYDAIETELQNLANQPTVTSVMVPDSASYFIDNIVPSDKRTIVTSPVLLEKCKKNDVEQLGMRNAHINDAIAVIQFLTDFEPRIQQGEYHTEISASNLLDNYRSIQENYFELSFNTISAFGPNAAIIHYSATNDTNAVITSNNVHMLDSGGNYFDGTTDITRTLYYGDNPDPMHIEAYTRVLMGQIDFATVYFPPMTPRSYIDILARRPLYAVGWDYRHGTSHGIGAFLSVHEGCSGYLELGWFGSDEPGYYEEDYFGIRLENVVGVIEVNTPYNFLETTYGFETITLVPYEPKLIDISIMTAKQCRYVNDYHAKVNETMIPILQDKGLTNEVDWLTSKTAPLPCP